MKMSAKKMRNPVLVCLTLLFLTFADAEEKSLRKWRDLSAVKRIAEFCKASGWDKQVRPKPYVNFPVVAFTAILSHDASLGQKQAVIYDKVLANIGNGYNKLNGQFVVPYDGLYTISVSMMADPKNSIHLNLVRNGIELVRLWTQNGRWELASHTLNIPLKKNDHLWVRQLSGSVLWGRENYNLFSVALLRAGSF